MAYAAALFLLTILIAGLLFIPLVRRIRLRSSPAFSSAPPTKQKARPEESRDPAHSGPGLIEGRVKASSMKTVSEIVDKHPDEVVSVLRRWIRSDDPET